jgi:uncharacterized membrane protein YhaH (DUF805 family)
MSVPALEHWFSVKIRRNRKSFVLANVALIVIFCISYFVWLYFAQASHGESLGFVIFGIPTSICSYFLVAQRLRDFGVNGWFSLLWIPVNVLEGEVRIAITLAALLVLCGIPGTPGANRFGANPLA